MDAVFRRYLKQSEIGFYCLPTHRRNAHMKFFDNLLYGRYDAVNDFFL